MVNLGAARLRHFFAVVLSMGVLLVTGTASAVGRVEWKTKTLKESDGHSWTIDVAIYLNKAPDVATMPMRFSFQPVVYYERSLLDGREGPQLRKVPLENKPPMVESVDVGFLDPGSGQIQKRTKFSFKVTRGHGYEAGEYDVTIKDGRTDATIGSQVRLVFEGENEVIDRRAVVFSGEKKKDDKAKEGDDKKESDEDAPPKKKELSTDDPAYWEGGPKSTGDQEQNEEVEPKRGCGCKVSGSSAENDTLGLLLGVSVLGAARARRRRAA